MHGLLLGGVGVGPLTGKVTGVLLLGSSPEMGVSKFYFSLRTEVLVLNRSSPRIQGLKDKPGVTCIRTRSCLVSGWEKGALETFTDSPVQKSWVFHWELTRPAHI